MAEIQRVSSPLLSPPSRPRSARRPRLPHPPSRHHGPLQIPLEKTESLWTPVHQEVPIRSSNPAEAVQVLSADEAPVRGERSDIRFRVPPRTHAERVLTAVLLLGLGLIAVVLVINPALTRSDFLLGITVLCAGIALLTLMEVCRRTGPSRR